MKLRQVGIFIFIILLADQALKFYIKTNYVMNAEHNMVGNWAKLHFIENKGMAWGLEFGGDFGKLFLTLFRLFAVFFGVYYIQKIVREKQHKCFIICVALIFAGAVGNLIDSLFYGLIFTESYEGGQVAKLVPFGHGYGTFLHGKVVDMLYFPIVNGSFPNWVPFVGNDKSFTFFSPVFNLADASISVGVILILLNQNRYFHKSITAQHATVETNSTVNDSAQVF